MYASPDNGAFVLFKLKHEEWLLLIIEMIRGTNFTVLEVNVTVTFTIHPF